MRRKSLLFTLLLCAVPSFVFSMTEGYILCGSYGGTKTYLFDKSGAVVHTWDHSGLSDNLNGYSCYLLENGNLLRSGQTNNEVSSGAAPKQGTLSEIGFNGNVIWGWYDHATKKQMMHHDFKPMPNGNVLCVSFITFAKDSALALGLDSSVFSSSGMMGGMAPIGGGGSSSIELEKIFEFTPDRTGAGNHQIIWEWNIWDHIIPKEQATDHPELFSGDLGPTFFGQWVHLNGIDYNAERDLITFTSRIFSEMFIIDHSTSTAEAAGHTGGTYGKGGDIVFRWGKPSNFCISTTVADTDTVVTGWGTRKDTIYNITLTKTHENDYLRCLHCPNFIPAGYQGAGNVLFFHNNVNAGMAQLGMSEAVEVALPDPLTLAINTPSAPLAPTWKYCPAAGTDSMFSASMSSALRMKCGNTLIHEAYPGGNYSAQGSRVREVNQAGEVIWGPISLEPQESDTTDSTDTGETSGFIMPGFNAAKIMYYPEDYPGIVKLFQASGIKGARTGAAVKTVKSFTVALRGRELRFGNVEGAVITICSLRGKQVDRFAASRVNMSYPTTSLAAGTYLVTVALEGNHLTRLINIVR